MYFSLFISITHIKFISITHIKFISITHIKFISITHIKFFKLVSQADLTPNVFLSINAKLKNTLNYSYKKFRAL